MKITLLMAAAVALMASGAGAVELPKLLAQQGNSFWCEETVRSDAMVTVLRMTGGAEGRICSDPKARFSDFFLADEVFGTWEFGWGTDSTCSPMRISKQRRVRDYETEWTVVARCADHDTRKPTTRVQRFTFNLFKGNLNTITVNTGRR